MMMFIAGFWMCGCMFTLILLAVGAKLHIDRPELYGEIPKVDWRLVISVILWPWFLLNVLVDQL